MSSHSPAIGKPCRLCSSWPATSAQLAEAYYCADRCLCSTQKCLLNKGTAQSGGICFCARFMPALDGRLHPLLVEQIRHTWPMKVGLRVESPHQISGACHQCTYSHMLEDCIWPSTLGHPSGRV